MHILQHQTEDDTSPLASPSSSPKMQQQGGRFSSSSSFFAPPTSRHPVKMAFWLIKLILSGIGVTGFILLFSILFRLSNNRALYELSFHQSLKKVPVLTFLGGDNNANNNHNNKNNINREYSSLVFAPSWKGTNELHDLAVRDHQEKISEKQKFMKMFGKDHLGFLDGLDDEDEVAARKQQKLEDDSETKNSNKNNNEEVSWRTQAPASAVEVNKMMQTSLQNLLPKNLQLISSKEQNLHHRIGFPDGVQHLFIATNLHNSEDILPLWLREMKRLLLFVSDPPAASFSSSARGETEAEATARINTGQYARLYPKRIFLSIFTNKCKDYTNTILKHDFVPWLKTHGISYNINTEGVVEGGFSKRPPWMDRIDWLSRVRNAAMQPLWDEGTRIFFEPGDRLERVKLVKRAKKRIMLSEKSKLLRSDEDDRVLLMDANDANDNENKKDGNNNNNNVNEEQDNNENAEVHEDLKEQQKVDNNNNNNNNNPINSYDLKEKQDDEQIQKVDLEEEKERREQEERDAIERAKIEDEKRHEQEDKDAAEQAKKEKENDLLVQKEIEEDLKAQRAKHARERRNAEGDNNDNNNNNQGNKLNENKRHIKPEDINDEFDLLGEERVARRETQRLLDIKDSLLPSIDSVRVLFLNDIVFTAEDLLVLLHTNDGHYDMTCGMDYYWNFYDTWVSRDLDGNPFWSAPPYSSIGETRQNIRDLKPTKVSCCWNGAIIAKAAVFLKEISAEKINFSNNNLDKKGADLVFKKNNKNKKKEGAVAAGTIPEQNYLPPEFQNKALRAAKTNSKYFDRNVRFRALPSSSCPMSECLLLCKDMQKHKYGKFTEIYINPIVRVGYLLEDYLSHHGNNFALDFFEASSWSFAKLNTNLVFVEHNSDEHHGKKLEKPPKLVSGRNKDADNSDNDEDASDNDSNDPENCNLSTLAESDAVTRRIVTEIILVLVVSLIFMAILSYWIYLKQQQSRYGVGARIAALDSSASNHRQNFCKRFIFSRFSAPMRSSTFHDEDFTKNV